MQYRFETGLTIHEIKKLYGGVGFTHYLQDIGETARGIANSTLLTARDEDGSLVGLIRGVSDMHTVLFIQDLIVLPEYQHQASATNCWINSTNTSNKSRASWWYAMIRICKRSLPLQITFQKTTPPSPPSFARGVY